MGGAGGLQGQKVVCGKAGCEQEHGELGKEILFSTAEAKSIGVGQRDKTCYGLNVCVPLKFTCGSPNPQCDGIRRWDPWEEIRL